MQEHALRGPLLPQMTKLIGESYHSIVLAYYCSSFIEFFLDLLTSPLLLLWQMCNKAKE